MIPNRIKVLRAEHNISATTLAGMMPEGTDKVVMSYVERGRVLPTREGLEIMCDLFSCIPTDIYQDQDIDLLSVKKVDQPPTVSNLKLLNVDMHADEILSETTEETHLRTTEQHHEGMEQVRVWISAEEKAALFKAVSCLGYPSVAEWLREKYRSTLREYVELQLNEKRIHEMISTTTGIKPSGVVD